MVAVLRTFIGREADGKRLRDGDSASEALGLQGLPRNRAHRGAGRESYSGEFSRSRWGSALVELRCVLRRAPCGRLLKIRCFLLRPSLPHAEQASERSERVEGRTIFHHHSTISLSASGSVG